MSNENGHDTKIRKIIIAGGGSSGWMSASYLSKALGADVDITVIESTRIGRIGVGEATIPTIKEVFFDFLGIPEEEWMPECNGTYKLGIRYENWKKSLSAGGDYYYHNFGEMPNYEGIPLSHFWLKKKLEGFSKSLDYSCYPTSAISDEGKSPRFMNGKRAVHSAYHFNALDLADFLRDWSIKRGVHHVVDDIVQTKLTENGNIKSLTVAGGKKYFGDLFIDCSGFSALLIEKELKEPFISFAESLMTDSAIAINIPADSEQENIRPYTTASALDNGWMWQIPLYDRSGNGYVFSSCFTTPEKAEKEMRGFFGKKAEKVDSRLIKFRSGRRRRSWVNNCVSIGLASGFLEPLESTGLYFVYAALYQLAEHFPDKTLNPALRNKFNERVAFMVEDVRDFIVMHFCTSPRTDTPYWKANMHDLKITDSLKEILALQKAGIPIRKSYHDNENLYTAFNASFDRFWTNSNYQSVLCGVGFLPERIMPQLNHRHDIVAGGDKLFAEIEARTNKLLSELPSHYDYLKAQKEKYEMRKSAVSAAGNLLVEQKARD